MPKVVPGYKAEARARIVEAATRLFTTKGYRRTTMDDVADALGVSKGALYLYYRSKVELLEEIQAENRRWSRRWMQDALAEGDPSDRLFGAFDEVFRSANNRAQLSLWFEILGEAAHDEEIRRAILHDHREDLRSLRKFLAELRRRNLLPADADLEVLAFTLVSLFQAAVWDLCVGFEPDRVRVVLQASMRTLLGHPPAAPRRGGRAPTRSPGPRRASSAARARRSSGSST